MSAVTISHIEERLRHLSPSELSTVFEFVSFLVARRRESQSVDTMLATEDVLRRDWDSPEEDAAWRDL